MTILTVYVYSPLAGWISGRDYYCGATSVCNGDGGIHGSCGGGQNRVDVAGSGTLYFRATNIRSLYLSYGTCGSGCSTDIMRTLKISLYGKPDGFCPVGSVLYAHVGQPLLPSGLQNYSGGLLAIGSTPSGTCGDFYTGAHSHMERFGGTVVAPCCYANVTTGTAIYKFTWDDSIICPGISELDFEGPSQ